MDSFISDPHFGHKNIVRGCSSWEGKAGCRDFNTLDEHDETLLDGINSVAAPDDTLFCVGDWSFGGVENVRKYRDRIRCRNIVLIYGNHDKQIRRDRALRDLFVWSGDYRVENIGKQRIVMFHYFIPEWEDMNRGSWMLHGHHHNSWDHTGHGKTVDLCPERENRNRPWTFDELRDYMDAIPMVGRGHHV